MSSWGDSSSHIPKIGSSKKVISLSRSKNNCSAEKNKQDVDDLVVSAKLENDPDVNDDFQVQEVCFYNIK